MADVMLSLDSLVTLQTDVVPYMLDWPVLGESSEVGSLVVLVRPGGFLLALPLGVIPDAVLRVGNEPSPPGPVGPSTVLVLPAVILDNGLLSPTGANVSVLVVDMAELVLSQMRVVGGPEEAVFSFEEDQPYAFLDPGQLQARVQEWLEATGETSGLGYVTAEPELDEEPLEEEEDPNVQTPPVRRRRATVPGRVQATGSGKKPTVASLAGAVEQLLQSNAAMMQQMENLSIRQIQLEKKEQGPVPQMPSQASALRQPISSALTVPLIPATRALQSLGPPPKTVAPTSPGLLRSPLGPAAEFGELALEKEVESQSSSKDNLAQAVLAQSQALTALVGQIAAQGSDPMLELGSLGSSASTRGAQGRAKLQAELASQRGAFFASVLASMSRRMQPTAPVEGTPGELMSRGICGTKYLERFGGFGKHRELGCLQHQVMTIMDFLQTENLQGARDATALLAVCLDQAVLDNARFDLAFLLCLQEEPPATVFTHREPNILSKTRAFSPLADQKWVTVALAYIKELDVISAKRLELTSSSAPAPLGSGGGDKPKAKPFPKKKGKGAGKNSQGNAEGEEQ